MLYCCFPIRCTLRRSPQIYGQRTSPLSGRRHFLSHGTRDPFGSVEELSMTLALIPAATHLVAIESGHDLLRGKFDVRGLIVQPFRDTLSA